MTDPRQYVYVDGVTAKFPGVPARGTLEIAKRIRQQFGHIGPRGNFPGARALSEAAQLIDWWASCVLPSEERKLGPGTLPSPTIPNAATFTANNPPPVHCEQYPFEQPAPEPQPKMPDLHCYALVRKDGARAAILVAGSRTEADDFIATRWEPNGFTVSMCWPVPTPEIGLVFSQVHYP